MLSIQIKWDFRHRQKFLKSQYSKELEHMTIRNENDKDFGDSKNQNPQKNNKIDKERFLPKDNLGNTIYERFEGKYGISWDIDAEKLNKASWFKQRGQLVESFASFEVTWIAKWHDILEDMGKKVAEKTLRRLLDELYMEKLIGLCVFKPKSKFMNVYKIYYMYSAIEKLEKTLSILREMDEGYSIKQKKPKTTPKEIAKHNIEVKRETLLAEDKFNKEQKEKQKKEKIKSHQKTNEVNNKRFSNIKKGLICPSKAIKHHLSRMKENHPTQYANHWLKKGCKLKLEDHPDEGIPLGGLTRPVNEK